jgi:hypothetical protein
MIDSVSEEESSILAGCESSKEAQFFSSKMYAHHSGNRGSPPFCML